MADDVSVRPRRRGRWWIIGALVVLVVAWLAVLSIRTWSAYRHDQQGLAALSTVRSNLTPGQLTAEESVRLLDVAHGEFAAAQADLSSPLFDPLTVVPVIGRQVRAVRALNDAAVTVSGVGSSFLDSVHGLLNQPHGAGPERVASLRKLAALSLSAERRLAGVDPGPSTALIGPLASKHATFVSQLDDARSRLTKAAAVSAVVATILQGPQAYLVLASNNAEMRAGSGAFLEVGAATTGDGTVHLGDLSPSGDLTLPVGAVTATGDLARNWGWLEPGVDWRNLGVTPQFDVTAKLAAQMWAALTGQQVNGVLALDVEGVRQLLEATGPVQVNGQTISADNVVTFLLHDQYAGLSDNAAGTAARKDALGSLASEVLRQLQGQTTDLHTLANAVSSAVAGRHLLLWSSDPAAQAAWVVSGVSGTLTPDSLAVTVINRGGNKLDQYLPVKVAVDTLRVGSSTAVTMTIRLSNDTPPGQSQFVAGPYPGVPVAYGGYTGIVAVNLPARATALSMTGAGPLSAKGPEGPTWLLAAPVTISQGGSATVVVTFRLPGTSGSMTVVPSARIPPEQWAVGSSAFSDSAATKISW